MHQTAKWITYNGTKVLLNDYSGYSGEAFCQTIPINAAHIISVGDPGLLLLLDISNATVDKEIVACFKQASADVKDYTKKTAIVGVNGLQNILLSFVNKFSNIGTVPFETREEALDWLTR